IPCLVCSETDIKVSHMRERVGCHTLAASRTQLLSNSSQPAITMQSQMTETTKSLTPCGFCGLDGCATQLIKANKKGKPSFSIKSQCQYRYTRLQYKNTSTFNPAKPTCTNVPIHCPLC
ncbi:hypothetical protein BKA70DRAFT_1079778, partial [Coprinopsis sp. MPI-PUGE-AT-0042]